MNETKDANNLKDKARGMMIGLAIGDALGAPLEHGYSSKDITDQIEIYRHMHDTEHFPKGVWTDDTSMALCLADSLIECLGYDSWVVMDKYKKWRDEGDRSYFPYGEGIGIQTDNAIERYSKGDQLIRANEERTTDAGNGAVMRLAPVVIATIHSDNLATAKLARVSARETHYSHEAETTTEIFALMLRRAANEKDKKRVIDVSSFSAGKLFDEILMRVTKDINSNELKDLGGYIIDTVRIAVWGLLNFGSFEDGMIAVLCLGGDTDTNAAVYGQLAGAFYGLSEIPKEWQTDLYLKDELVSVADELLSGDEHPVLYTRFEEDTVRLK